MQNGKNVTISKANSKNENKRVFFMTASMTAL
jgi:hypothetical protein